MGAVRCFGSACLYLRHPRHEKPQPIVHILDDDASFRMATGELLNARGCHVALCDRSSALLDPSSLIVDFSFDRRLSDLGQGNDAGQR